MLKVILITCLVLACMVHTTHGSCFRKQGCRLNGAVLSRGEQNRKLPGCMTCSCSNNNVLSCCSSKQSFRGNYPGCRVVTMRDGCTRLVSLRGGPCRARRISAVV